MASMSEGDDVRVRRGIALREAVASRPGLTIKTLCALARVSEPTYRAAVRGEASSASYDALENGVRLWDENPEPPDTRVITVELSGVVGVESIKIRGYSEAVDELAETVQAILESVRGGQIPPT